MPNTILNPDEYTFEELLTYWRDKFNEWGLTQDTYWKEAHQMWYDIYYKADRLAFGDGECKAIADLYDMRLRRNVSGKGIKIAVIDFFNESPLVHTHGIDVTNIIKAIAPDVEIRSISTGGNPFDGNPATGPEGSKWSSISEEDWYFIQNEADFINMSLDGMASDTFDVDVPEGYTNPASRFDVDIKGTFILSAGNSGDMDGGDNGLYNFIKGKGHSVYLVGALVNNTLDPDFPREGSLAPYSNRAGVDADDFYVTFIMDYYRAVSSLTALGYDLIGYGIDGTPHFSSHGGSLSGTSFSAPTMTAYLALFREFQLTDQHYLGEFFSREPWSTVFADPKDLPDFVETVLPTPPQCIEYGFAGGDPGCLPSSEGECNPGTYQCLAFSEADPGVPGDTPWNKDKEYLLKKNTSDTLKRTAADYGAPGQDGIYGNGKVEIRGLMGFKNGYGYPKKSAEELFLFYKSIGLTKEFGE